MMGKHGGEYVPEEDKDAVLTHYESDIIGSVVDHDLEVELEEIMAAKEAFSSMDPFGNVDDVSGFLMNSNPALLELIKKGEATLEKEGEGK
jgi:hypothetical protein